MSMKYEVEYVGDEEMEIWIVHCLMCNDEEMEGSGLDASDWMQCHECAPEPFRPGLLFPDGEPVVAKVLSE